MIYVRGFPEINGENFPLDIWSLYMQEATKDLPRSSISQASTSNFKLRRTDAPTTVRNPLE